MQNILFDAELSVHKFGSHLLHVPSLKNWAEAKGFHFPKTNPPIEDYEFVQVEALLVAIMRVVHSSMTPEEGFAFVQNDSELKGEQLAQHPITAKWLLGADVHSQWRKEIAASIKKGELQLLKNLSLLPVTSEDLEVLFSSLPYTQTGTIGILQKESKGDKETNGRDAGNDDYKKASEQQSNISKHILNGSPRRNTDLTAEICKAMSMVDDSTNNTLVWNTLKEMAINEEGSFTGTVDEKGLHYVKSSRNDVAVLNIKALGKRLKRKRDRGTT